MGDTFTNNLVDEEPVRVAGMDFHHGAMDFSVSYSVPNKVDSMLKNQTIYPSVSIAKRGKHPIVAKTVVTEDIPHSDVAKDWEERNDKAITIPRGDEVPNELPQETEEPLIIDDTPDDQT